LPPPGRLCSCVHCYGYICLGKSRRIVRAVSCHGYHMALCWFSRIRRSLSSGFASERKIIHTCLCGNCSCCKMVIACYHKQSCTHFPQLHNRSRMPPFKISLRCITPRIAHYDIQQEVFRLILLCFPLSCQAQKVQFLLALTKSMIAEDAAFSI